MPKHGYGNGLGSLLLPFLGGQDSAWLTEFESGNFAAFVRQKMYSNDLKLLETEVTAQQRDQFKGRRARKRRGQHVPFEREGKGLARQIVVTGEPLQIRRIIESGIRLFGNDDVLDSRRKPS